MPNNNNDGALYKTKNICNILLQEKNRATKAVTDFTINANLSIDSIQFKQKNAYPSMYRGVMTIFIIFDL